VTEYWWWNAKHDSILHCFPNAEIDAIREWIIRITTRYIMAPLIDL